jgi:hypothetical protein
VYCGAVSMLLLPSPKVQRAVQPLAAPASMLKLSGAPTSRWPLAASATVAGKGEALLVLPPLLPPPQACKKSSNAAAPHRPADKRGLFAKSSLPS